MNWDEILKYVVCTQSAMVIVGIVVIVQLTKITSLLEEIIYSNDEEEES